MDMDIAVADSMSGCC